MISRVHYRDITRRFCANCGKPWDSHLPLARESMRQHEPDHFYVENGVEYPTLTSYNVECYVTTATCGELAKAVAV